MPHILFVCHGNTCRSPMAEGLARHILGEKVDVESAGKWPGLEVAPEAVETLRAQYGIDISAHRPRAVSALALDVYDRIIALDAGIYEYLSSNFPRARTRLTGWDIRDPYGHGLADYARAVGEIEREIHALAADLQKPAESQ